jgi:putative ABC transport system permease protein
MTTPLPPFRYPEAAARAQFYRNALERLSALPGVSNVGLVDTLPLSGIAGRIGIHMPGQNAADQLTALARVVGADYFRAMQIPLRRGRYVTAQDGETKQAVVVISEQMANRYWPNRDPIGQTFAFGRARNTVTVVGVVGDVRHWLGQPTMSTFYRPYEPNAPETAAFVLRTSGPPMAMSQPAQRAIWSLDRNQPVTYVRTFDGDLADQAWARRLGAAVLGLFGFVALVIAASGIFGVISTTVAQRTREIGIRTAMGAEPGAIVRMVLRDVIGWIALGLVLGVLGTLALTRYLGSLLYTVTPTDTSTFLVTTSVMALVALLASYLPAWYASRIEPVDALSGR